MPVQINITSRERIFINADNGKRIEKPNKFSSHKDKSGEIRPNGEAKENAGDAREDEKE